MLKTDSHDINVVAPALAADETFFTRREAASYLRCSIPTLDRWHAQGSGPDATYIGSRRLYSLAALRNFAGVKVVAA